MTAFVFASSPAAQRSKDYFVRSLQIFYTADELSQLLADLGYQNIANQALLGGMVVFHHVVKAM